MGDLEFADSTHNDLNGQLGHRGFEFSVQSVIASVIARARGHDVFFCLWLCHDRPRLSDPGAWGLALGGGPFGSGGRCEVGRDTPFEEVDAPPIVASRSSSVMGVSAMDISPGER